MLNLHYLHLASVTLPLNTYAPNRSKDDLSVIVLRMYSINYAQLTDSGHH